MPLGGWGEAPVTTLAVLLQDLQNLRAQNVCVMTDGKLALLPPVEAVLCSLDDNTVKYQVYDNVRVEPTDTR